MSGRQTHDPENTNSTTEAAIALGASKPRCLLVLGMHRSGTSALTRVISMLGATLPRQLNLASEGNVTGYWESEALIAHNEAFLSRLDSTWYDWRELDLGRLTRARRDSIAAELAHLIALEYQQAPLIVLKEPRICRFAALVFEALDSLGYDTRPVLPIRSPLDVVASLGRRDGMGRAQAALLWLRHVLDAELASRHRPRAIVAYDDLLSDWQKTLTQIRHRCEVEWTYHLAEVEGQVEAFLSPARRHFSSNLDDVVVDPIMRPWLSDSYAALLVLARDPNSVSAMGTLDRVRREFSSAAALLEQLIREEREASARVAREIDIAQRTIADQQAREREDLLSIIGQLQVHSDAAAAEADVSAAIASDRIVALETALTTAASSIALLEQTIQKHEAEAANLSDQLQLKELAVGEMRESLERVEGDRAVLEARLAEIVNANQEANERIEKSERIERDLRTECAHLSAALSNQIASIKLERFGMERDLRARENRLAELQTMADGHRLEVCRLEALLATRDEQLANTRWQSTAERNELELAAEQARRRIEDGELLAARLKQEISQRELHLNAIAASTSWKITRPLRGIKRLIVDAAFRLSALTRNLLGSRRYRAQHAHAAGGVMRRWTWRWVRHVMRGIWTDPAYRRHVLRRLFRSKPDSLGQFVRGHIGNGLRPRDASRAYDAWLAANRLSQVDVQNIRAALATAGAKAPKISVIMPVYNSDPRLLREAIDSVQRQIYADWELCVVDDCSPSEHIRPLLAEIARSDSRIRVKRRRENGGISECTNTAVNMARGEILVFVDHDDLITPDCLAEVALYYANNPEADIVYSDDDKADMEGSRFAPQFKPDFAPTLLLSFMYMGHVFSVRREIFRELGGFRKPFDGAQDFDFALRATERARHVGHIAKVLYSWRVAPGSTALSAETKPESFEAGRRAVEEAIARRGMAGRVVHPNWALEGKCGIFSIEFPDIGPSVTIIIPTHNNVALLRPCVESLAKTTYNNFKVMVVDNDSDDLETLSYLAELRLRENVVVERISNAGMPFSYAKINNEAVARSTSEFALLLNNDTEIIEPRWLSQMMGYALMEGVGAVGAKLLFGDGTVQHAGILHGLYGGLAGCAFRNAPSYQWGYFNFMRVAREYGAVTAACLLIRKSLFETVGGFDEHHFKVAYNDVDLCYRLEDAGYRSVYCSTAELFHYEGKSRGLRDDPREVEAFRAKYRDRCDRWYNPNLSLEDEHFQVRVARSQRQMLPVRGIMVSHNLEHEGAPNVMMEVVCGLKCRGVLDPIVLSPRDGPLRSDYENAGITVEIVDHPIMHVHDDAAFASAMDRFGSKLRSINAHFVYGNTLQTFWAIAGAKSAGLPAVWNPRESEEWNTYFDYLAPPLRPHAYAAFEYAYSVVFCADATRVNWMPVLENHNYRVIRDGLNEARFAARAARWSPSQARAHLGISNTDVVAVLVGTVCDRKGQIDLVHALGMLSDSAASRVRVFIVGDRGGEYSEKVHDAVSVLPSERRGRVHVVKETSDPYLYFRAADISVCTSRIESYPRVILEAMACGLPIISTAVFGIVEQVRDGVNALFYEQGRHAELASKLEQLVLDEAMRKRMADNSIHVLRSLTSFEEMLDGFQQLFGELGALPTNSADEDVVAGIERGAVR